MQVQRMTATRVATAAMIMMAAMATTGRAQELLLNNDFEQGPIDRGAPNYTVYGNGFTSGEYARTEGGKSFKAYSPFYQVGAGSVALQSVAATAGSSYTLTGYMFSPANDHVQAADIGIIELSFLDSTGASIANSATQRKFLSTDPTDTWLNYSITSTAPANAARANVTIGYIEINDPSTGGAIFWDDLSLKQAVVATESNWIATSSGGWLSSSNWQNGLVPNAVDAVANFGTSITGPTTVTIAGAGVTSGTVRFNNATNAYTVAGPGALTLDVATGSAALTVTAGSHAINAPLIVNDSTVATIASGQTLTLGGALTLANGSQLSTAGAGTLRISAASVTGSTGASVRANGGVLESTVDLGNNVDTRADAGELRLSASQHVRSLTIASGAKATLPDVSTARILRTSSFSLATGGTFDLGDNAAVIDYTTTSPAAAIRAAIIAGKAGNFAGTGLTSTKVVADPRLSIGSVEASQIGSPTTFLGETGIDSTTVLVRVTFRGDSNLSGNVDFADLLKLAQNFGAPGTGATWADGDNDYNGKVDFSDLLALAQNFSSTLSASQSASLDSGFAADWALAQSLVPEPTSLATIGLSTLLLRRRRAIA